MKNWLKNLFIFRGASWSNWILWVKISCEPYYYSEVWKNIENSDLVKIDNGKIVDIEG